VTISAFIIVRILRLKFACGQPDEVGCEQVLSPKAWKLLWIKRVSRTLPDTASSMKWAYTEHAKARWLEDTKQAGKAVGQGIVARMVQATNHP
jgi:hypothetical protein